MRVDGDDSKMRSNINELKASYANIIVATLGRILNIAAKEYYNKGFSNDNAGAPTPRELKYLSSQVKIMDIGMPFFCTTEVVVMEDSLEFDMTVGKLTLKNSLGS